MGKVKRARSKAAKALAGTAAATLGNDVQSSEMQTDMTFAKFKKALSDFDTRSVRSFKSIKSEVAGDKQMTKKDKLKLRHDLFLHKIDTTIKSRTEAKKRKRKLKKAISGNMVPLYDALPDLKSLLKPKDAPVEKNPANQPKPKAVQKATTRRKQMQKQTDLFKRLMSHPEFKTNPQQVIASHIQATLEQDAAREGMQN